jgi:ubiquinone/menaquinone biosynthesis C-methylase UbiE
MDKHIGEIQRDWNDLAEIDPLWAIAADDRKSHGKWELDEFFETGRQRVSHVLAVVRAAGRTARPGKALDFGCGVGRMTQALAVEFRECCGVDISDRMVELANRFNRYGDRCKYVVNLRSDLSIFDSDWFDFVYTVEVLQHLPAELMKHYLTEFVRVLAPGGLLVFEIPVERTIPDHRNAYIRSLPKYHPRRIVNKLKGVILGHGVETRYKRLRRLGLSKSWLYKNFGLRPLIPMNTLASHEILALIGGLGADVTEAESYVYGGTRYSLFIAEKRRRNP